MANKRIIVKLSEGDRAKYIARGKMPPTHRVLCVEVPSRLERKKMAEELAKKAAEEEE